MAHIIPPLVPHDYSFPSTPNISSEVKQGEVLCCYDDSVGAFELNRTIDHVSSLGYLRVKGLLADGRLEGESCEPALQLQGDGRF
jgi:hypothetical protein